MKRLGLALGLLVLAASLPAHAGETDQNCCACFIPDHDTAVPAFFCVSGNERETIAASQRCSEIPDAQLLCIKRVDEASSVSQECVEELRGESIICPAISAVPALGIPALVVVAGILSLLGAMTLRRRSLSSASSKAI
jgi:hypothetical protein